MTNLHVFFPELVLDHIEKHGYDPDDKTLMIPSDYDVEAIEDAVCCDALVINRIENPSREAILCAFDCATQIIHFINKDVLTKDILLELVAKYPCIIDSIDQDEELYLLSLRRGYLPKVTNISTTPAIDKVLEYFREYEKKIDRDNEWIDEAMTIYPPAIEFINNPPPSACIKALDYDPKLVKHMNDQDMHIKKYALDKDPNVIEHLEQDDELCWYALRKRSNTLRHIKNQSEDMINYALDDDYNNIVLVRKPKHRHCMRIFDKTCLAIAHMKKKNITQDIAISAFTRQPSRNSYPYTKNREDMEELLDYFYSLVPMELKIETSKTCTTDYLHKYHEVYNDPDLYQHFAANSIIVTEGENLINVQKEYCSDYYSLCMKALSMSPASIKYVDPSCYTEEMLDFVASKDLKHFHNMLYDIPGYILNKYPNVKYGWWQLDRRELSDEEKMEDIMLKYTNIILYQLYDITEEMMMYFLRTYIAEGKPAIYTPYKKLIMRD